MQSNYRFIVLTVICSWFTNYYKKSERTFLQHFLFILKLAVHYYDEKYSIYIHDCIFKKFKSEAIYWYISDRISYNYCLKETFLWKIIDFIFDLTSVMKTISRKHTEDNISFQNKYLEENATEFIEKSWRNVFSSMYICILMY